MFYTLEIYCLIHCIVSDFVNNRLVDRLKDLIERLNTKFIFHDFTDTTYCHILLCLNSFLNNTLNVKLFTAILFPL